MLHIVNYSIWFFSIVKVYVCYCEEETCIKGLPELITIKKKGKNLSYLGIFLLRLQAKSLEVILQDFHELPSGVVTCHSTHERHCLINNR